MEDLLGSIEDQDMRRSSILGLCSRGKILERLSVPRGERARPKQQLGGYPQLWLPILVPLRHAAAKLHATLLLGRQAAEHPATQVAAVRENANA
eukprot:CAMPEP_0119310524 /NCGR_PEP_ID=MMETSP1333-20130426/19618_1 /TAXON_ID=418940 /ORGANISM="Scyphosphaera apsteinii, Strain RCC1455" /LENGTH=93 /DNA_ID=CAMNT_0007314719 /DNA_START=198 /DNA_END=479 /DNA_ORIENTATION=-